jgi:hypothetical protein
VATHATAKIHRTTCHWAVWREVSCRLCSNAMKMSGHAHHRHIFVSVERGLCDFSKDLYLVDTTNDVSYIDTTLARICPLLDNMSATNCLAPSKKEGLFAHPHILLASSQQLASIRTAPSLVHPRSIAPEDVLGNH